MSYQKLPLGISLSNTHMLTCTHTHTQTHTHNHTHTHTHTHTSTHTHTHTHTHPLTCLTVMYTGFLYSTSSALSRQIKQHISGVAPRASIPRPVSYSSSPVGLFLGQ